MKPPDNFVKINRKKRYSTATAKLLAGNDWYDGHNCKRRGSNVFLYVSHKGQYFIVTLSQLQGENNELQLVNLETAIGLYESILLKHRVKYAEAFPDGNIEEG